MFRSVRLSLVSRPPFFNTTETDEAQIKSDRRGLQFLHCFYIFNFCFWSDFKCVGSVDRRNSTTLSMRIINDSTARMRKKEWWWWWGKGLNLRNLCSCEGLILLKQAIFLTKFYIAPFPAALVALSEENVELESPVFLSFDPLTQLGGWRIST